jgi:hypothetical protein
MPSTNGHRPLSDVEARFAKVQADLRRMERGEPTSRDVANTWIALAEAARAGRRLTSKLYLDGELSRDSAHVAMSHLDQMHDFAMTNAALVRAGRPPLRVRPL